MLSYPHTTSREAAVGGRNPKRDDACAVIGELHGHAVGVLQGVESDGFPVDFGSGRRRHRAVRRRFRCRHCLRRRACRPWLPLRRDSVSWSLFFMWSLFDPDGFDPFESHFYGFDEAVCIELHAVDAGLAVPHGGRAQRRRW